MDQPEKHPRKPRGKRAELTAWIERERPAEIGERAWAALLTALAPVSVGYLRRLLRATPDLRLAPVVEGVRQEDQAALERSLLALLEEYEHGDTVRRREVRRLVIEAKDHARLVAWKPERRAEKEEMVLWMLTWLENPPLFREWLALRRRARNH